MYIDGSHSQRYVRWRGLWIVHHRLVRRDLHSRVPAGGAPKACYGLAEGASNAARELPVIRSGKDGADVDDVRHTNYVVPGQLRKRWPRSAARCVTPAETARRGHTRSSSRRRPPGLRSRPSPRAEQARYLQIQLFRVGQVSDLAERLAPTRGGDDERAVAEQPAQDCALNSLDGVESGLIVTWAA
jgi:hypothetical protein